LLRAGTPLPLSASGEGKRGVPIAPRKGVRLSVV
jgi:hypothetical protein